MVKIQQPNRQRVRLVGPKLLLTWVISVVIFLLMLSSVLSLFSKHRKIKEQIKELKEEEIILRDKKTNLALTNEYINTPEGQEYIFRDKYRMLKPGEGMIVVTKKEEEPVLPKKPVFKRFWDSIKKGLGL